MPEHVPSLDALSGAWMPAADWAHLPSLRNQWGQAHANADLASISWLAIPPYSGGYRTGVLRIDGAAPPAQELRWRPWGVQRRSSNGGLVIETDTCLPFEQAAALWQVEVRNESGLPRACDLEFELLAPIARHATGWGWLYNTPWNHGEGHDFFATERIRQDVLSAEPRQAQLPPDESRVLRLGHPPIPGIQRDEDDSPMLIESALPDHTAPDWDWPRPHSVHGEVAWVEGEERIVGPWVLTGGECKVKLGASGWKVGMAISVRVRLDGLADGAILTHGNHPGSLQFLVEDGALVVDVGGERIRTGRRLEAGVWYELGALREPDAVAVLVDGERVGGTQPWWGSQRWSARVVSRTTVLVEDAATDACSAFTATVEPDSLTTEGQRGRAGWKLTLAPGEAFRVGISLEIGVAASDVLKRARQASAGFGERLAATRTRWQCLWANAFIPGNPDHSGYLPTLVTQDEGLEQTYYLACLLAVYMRNTGVSELGPVFLTGGPRLGPTVTFYWEQVEFSRVVTLLEPDATRRWLLAALSGDYRHSHSFDTRNLVTIGNHYAANDYALFCSVERYVGITGDYALLDEVASGKTVLEHLADMAWRPASIRAPYAGGVLADFGGDSWELLECVPNYRHVVMAFNAAYAHMLRALSSLLARRGDDVEGALARSEGDTLAKAVIGGYAGAGRWSIYTPTGIDTIGHCLDFALIAEFLSGDLPPAIAAQMVEFIATSLLDGDWMRALDPNDPIAPLADRPDHGAAGAFGAWPARTALGLCKLGQADRAASFLGRIHRARSGQLWGQGQETIREGHFRAAERSSSNRDSACAIASAEAVLAGLFELDPTFDGEQVGKASTKWGTLRNIRAVGFDLAPGRTIESRLKSGSVR
ncbi:MAG: hypothetical protein LBG60_11180 [Bifidobacteriaceae bacterium]|jgi:hypothetical protein|nr:hypothetical protein [Bifidobacteriaceae bacterium]